MSKIHFHKGDIIECQNGHYICEVSEDVYSGEACDFNVFINFKETKEPKLGTPVGNCTCAKCNSNWVISGQASPKFYVKGKGIV